MRYSRPVWQLMGDCAQELPDRFRFGHVQRWFETHYPDVNERTLRVHLVGLTEGSNTPNASLAKKPPLFRRVEHGEYAVLARLPAAATPEPADGDAGAGPDGGHVLLVGHDHEQRATPAPARELFTSARFAAARAGAAGPWFALSAEYGLLAPPVVVSPYARRLGAEPAAFRRAWARWVVAKLAVEIGELAATTVHLDAGDDVLAELVPVLESAGAIVRTADPDPVRV